MAAQTLGSIPELRRLDDGTPVHDLDLVYVEGRDVNERVCHLLDSTWHPICGSSRSKLTGSAHPTGSDPTGPIADCGLPRCAACVKAHL